MLKYADSKCTDKTFEVGQWVSAKFHHYKQKSVAKCLNFRLAKHYFGHFKILAKIGLVVYHLNLPEGTRNHPVLHISLLKTYQGSVPPVQVVCDVQNQHVLPKLEAIVAKRTVQTLEGDSYQVLVEWKSLPREDVTWENWDNLVNIYFALALKDKVLFHERGNDTLQVQKLLVPRLKGALSWAIDYAMDLVK